MGAKRSCERMEGVFVAVKYMHPNIIIIMYTELQC